MIPLRVVAELAGQISMPHHGLMLDALLAFAVAQREGLPPLGIGEEVVAIDIPMAREPSGRFYLTTEALPSWEQHDVRWVNRRFPVAEAQAWAESKFRRINIAAGAQRSYRLPLEVGYTERDELNWWCVGECRRSSTTTRYDSVSRQETRERPGARQKMVGRTVSAMGGLPYNPRWMAASIAPRRVSRRACRGGTGIASADVPVLGAPPGGAVLRTCVVVGELTLERAREALGGERADIVYSDPPWGPGNLMYWRTQNAEVERPDWPVFLATFCDVVNASVKEGASVFVEMGLRWVDELAAAMRRVGRLETARWECLYGSPKRPNILWYSGPEITVDPSGMSGVAMTLRALSGVAAPGALVFDPCCGRGMTARCALRLGMRFAGVELNPRRAAVTIAYLNGRK